MTISRRDFIKSGLSAMSMYMSAQQALFALGCPAVQTADSIAAQCAGKPRTLVMLQLTGGNDGFNTVIPYGLDAYYKARPRIGIKAEQVLKISDQIGLHPAMNGLHQLYAIGKVAIIQGVGYANASRSHYRSSEIWHSGDPEKIQTASWLERYLSTYQIAGEQDLFDGMNVGNGYSACQFENRLKAIAERIASGSHCPVYSANLDGFDTHSDQLDVHSKLLQQLSTGIKAFFADLCQRGLDNDVIVFVFSEFGRRLQENDSWGTDHGTAGPCFLIGSSINGGIYGDHPSLTDLVSDDVKYTTDLRYVYATLLDHCFQADSAVILGQPFEVLRFA